MRTRLAFLLLLIAFVLPAGAGASRSPKEQKVRQLIELSGGAAAARQVVDSMINDVATSRDLPAGFAEKFKELALKEDIVALYVPIYMKHLEDADLDAAITFYSSPAGRRLTQAQPAIVGDSMKVGQEWGVRLGERTMKELRASQPPKR